MPLIKCPDCDNDVSSEAVSCPKCGRPIKAALASVSEPRAASGTKIPKTALIAGAVVVLGIAGFALSSGGSKPKPAAKAVASVRILEKRIEIPFVGKPIAILSVVNEGPPTAARVFHSGLIFNEPCAQDFSIGTGQIKQVKFSCGHLRGKAKDYQLNLLKVKALN